MPTTSVRRRISLLRRSRGLPVDRPGHLDARVCGLTIEWGYLTAARPGSLRRASPGQLASIRWLTGWAGSERAPGYS
jgi:hypothetical protein